MISVVVMVKDGVRSETVGLELSELDADALVHVEDLFLEMKARVDRLATIRAAKARRADGDSK